MRTIIASEVIVFVKYESNAIFTMLRNAAMGSRTSASSSLFGIRELHNYQLGIRGVNLRIMCDIVTAYDNLL